jgi:hypothetical protein
LRRFIAFRSNLADDNFPAANYRPEPMKKNPRFGAGFWSFANRQKPVGFITLLRSLAY